MPFVTTSQANDITIVTFDDGKANALSFHSLDALHEAIVTAASHSSAVVLSGRPGVFSAGLDLDVIRSGDGPAIERLVARLADVVAALMELPVPLVAACTGHSLAGGAFLLLGCDYRVGPERAEAKIGITEVAVGLPLPQFAFNLADRRLDRRVLLRATLMAETVDPATAVSWGFLDELASDVRAAATDRARSLVESLDPAAFRATRAMVKRQLLEL